MSAFASDDKKPTGCGEADLVEVLYQLKKDQFVCVSIAGNIWYQFINHHWTLIDSGTTLRSSITTELRKIYYKKAETLMEQISNLPEGDNRKESLDKRVTKILAIVGRLGKTTDKKNMMIEAKDRFYDKDFLNNLDKNPWLMCFKNGVWDFQNGVFRDGKPEDYIHLHEWLDETKGWFGDSLHRMFRHHSEGIFEMEKRFGTEFLNSDGKIVYTKKNVKKPITNDMIAAKIHAL